MRERSRERYNSAGDMRIGAVENKKSDVIIRISMADGGGRYVLRS